MHVHFNSKTRKILYIAIIVIITGSFLLAFFIFPTQVDMFMWKQFGVTVPAHYIESHKFAFVMGEAHFSGAKEGDYDLKKAKAYYNRTLELKPRHRDALYQLGRIDFIQSKFYSAINKFTKVLEDGDADFVIHRSTYYMRGLTYGYMQLFDYAEEDFLNIIEAEGNKEWGALWAAQADLAWIYFQQGKFEEVLKITEEGLKNNPDNPWLLTNNGLALLNMNRKEQARGVLEKALKEASSMTAKEWDSAYPGNNPQNAPIGLQNMVETIESNLALVVDN